MTRGTHHASTLPLGAAGAGPRPGMVRDPPGAPLSGIPPHPFSLPTKHSTIAQTRVLAVLARNFSISLLSPSLLLIFGSFALR